MSALQNSDVVTVLSEILTELHSIRHLLQKQASTEFARTPEGLPICPKHNVVMKKRQKQGDTWYSHRIIHPETGEELYCRGYGSKNSPGWAIAPDQPPAEVHVAAPRRHARPTPATAPASPNPQFEATLASAHLSPAVHKALLTLAQSAGEAAALTKLNQMQGGA